MTPTTYTLYSEQKPKPEDFPIVAKWEQTPRIICNNKTLQEFISLAGRPTAWHRYIEPALPEPKKTPFEEWRTKIFTDHPDKIRIEPCECFEAGEAHGRSEERKRFREGVSSLLNRHDVDASSRFFAELRALADGKEAAS